LTQNYSDSILKQLQLGAHQLHHRHSLTFSTR